MRRPNPLVKDKRALLVKVPLSRGIDIPPAAWEKGLNFDHSYSLVREFFPGLLFKELLKLKALPRMRCLYIVFVTPPGDRENYYAWITPLGFNVKQAMIDGLWKAWESTK